jgi:TetR/AcrR family acrAB operon transcriptional repressor
VSDKPTPEARRQAILEAAIGVFAQRGFDAATTDDIARGAGLSKGGLYWHFKSKDDILAAILMQLFDQELGVLQGLLAAEGAVAPRLRRLVAQGVAAVLQLEQLLPVMLEFYALAARHTDARQFLQKYYQRYHQLLAELFEQGFAGGEFHRGTAEAAAIALIAQLEGLGLLWAIVPELVGLVDHSESAVDLLLRGLMAAADAAPASCSP